MVNEMKKYFVIDIRNDQVMGGDIPIDDYKTALKELEYQWGILTYKERKNRCLYIAYGDCVDGCLEYDYDVLDCRG